MRREFARKALAHLTIFCRGVRSWAPIEMKFPVYSVLADLGRLGQVAQAK
jgi:hypothetical protein